MLTKNWMLTPRTATEIRKRAKVDIHIPLQQLRQDGLVVKTGVGHSNGQRRFYWVEPMLQCKKQELAIGTFEIHDIEVYE